MRTRAISGALAVALAAGAAAPGADAATATPRRPAVEVVELLGPDGEPMVLAWEINRRGQVLGTVAPSTAVVWEDGDARRLAPEGTSTSVGYDLAENGDVAGEFVTAPFGPPRPFAWQDGEWIALGGNPLTGSASSVDERGRVLGSQGFAPDDPSAGVSGVVTWVDGQVDAVAPAHVRAHPLAESNDRGQALVRLAPGYTSALWDTVRGSVTPIPTLGGDENVATAINERGVVAGFGETAEGHHHAFVWRDGRLTDLGTLPGGRHSYVAGGINYPFHAEDNALNERGHVAGTSTGPGGFFRAFLWRDGRMVDLGTLGGRGSLALAVNNRDQVVGYSETADGALHAFLWEDGRMTDIGALAGPGMSRATDINDRGEVIGLVVDPVDLSHRAVLWRT